MTDDKNPESEIKQILQSSFPAFHPDGPREARFASGDFYVRKCPDCGWENGGAIFNEKYTKEKANRDRYDPVNQPCLQCGDGPPVWEFVCDTERTTEG